MWLSEQEIYAAQREEYICENNTIHCRYQGKRFENYTALKAPYKQLLSVVFFYVPARHRTFGGYEHAPLGI